MCDCCCRSSYTEISYWRDKEAKEYEDKIKELEKKLAHSQENLFIWREKALYSTPVYYKPAEPVSTFADTACFFFLVIFPWLVILAVFLFGWSGILG